MHEVIQDPDDMEKGDKVGSSSEGSKKRTVCVTPHPSLKTPHTYNNKQDYKGDTQDKTLDSDTHDSGVLKKDDASLKRNLDKEIKNADDDEYIDNRPLKKVSIKYQSYKNIRNRLLLKSYTIKLIDLILSNIVRYEENISSEDFINKRIETKDKWNQIHILSMESVLGANCRILLTHISNRKIWIEETNERINEFSFFKYLESEIKQEQSF